ncbi:MAG: maltose ABC transporter permease MalG [Synechococcaceae cyanobacterium SM2_3_1]|nr:maltose ABC transporter permease MalG [Synechococcaceae cyanobacterium SM2_3_1]
MPVVKGRFHPLRLLLTHLFLWVALAIILAPLLLILSISFREGNLAVGSLIPERFSWEHWQRVLGIPTPGPDGILIPPPFPVLQWLWNSLQISGIAAALLVVLSVTSAYAFSRLKFQPKQGLLQGLLLFQVFPAVLALVALYTLISQLGKVIPGLGLDTHGGLILVYLGGIAISVWMMKGYFDMLPASVEEAAQVDGANRIQILIYVLLPMSYPILAVVFMLSLITIFNEFPIASVLLFQEKNLTLAVGLRFFLQDQNFLWGDFAAAAIMGGVPITVIFLVTQRFLVAGLTQGAGKD